MVALDHLLASLADAGAERVTADPDLIDRYGLALTIDAPTSTQPAINAQLSEVQRVHVDAHVFTLHATIVSRHRAPTTPSGSDALTLLAVEGGTRVSPLDGAEAVRARAQHLPQLPGGRLP